ncbi:unnamed protein product [Rhizophagus irregularis]|uniref:Uncharacterized protein n=1 Tax=Rhizophagus irregularis TaxID=588596 RepID=A0A916ECQ9_9GLOM|nr:unnamed protein product [Rhizophagus irregularis]
MEISNFLQVDQAEEKRLDLVTTKQEYITKEYDFDIDMQSKQRSSLLSVNSTTRDFPRKRHFEELGIETQNDKKRIKT